MYILYIQLETYQGLDTSSFVINFAISQFCIIYPGYMPDTDCEIEEMLWLICRTSMIVFVVLNVELACDT